MEAAHDTHLKGPEEHQQGDAAAASAPVASKIDDTDATPTRNDPAAMEVKLDSGAMRPRFLACRVTQR